MKLAMPGPTVKKPDWVVRNRYSFESVQASRLLAVLFACIGPDGKLADEYCVPIFKVLPSHAGGRAYQQIIEACKILDKAYVEVLPEAPGGDSECVRFFSYVNYSKGIVKAKFNQDIMCETPPNGRQVKGRVSCDGIA